MYLLLNYTLKYKYEFKNGVIKWIVDVHTHTASRDKNVSEYEEYNMQISPDMHIKITNGINEYLIVMELLSVAI